MKAVFINGSPRKDWNTDKLLQRAAKGAERVGAEVRYYDLYNLQFSGCRSCFACKVKDKGCMHLSRRIETTHG